MDTGFESGTIVTGPLTRRSAVRWARERLRDAEVAAWRVEADVLVAEALRVSRYAPYLEPEAVVTDAERERLWDVVTRRSRREPLQYIVGHEEFWGLEFGVGPDVLIPRPETEGVVDAALRHIATRDRAVVADVGTGSGCLALAIAATAPEATVWAVDRSEAALAQASRNAATLGLGDRVHFASGDWFAPLVERGVRADVVVSNPPYVTDGDYAGLQPEVRYEPADALRGGPDGLQFYRRLASGVRDVLAPGGCVVVELGFGQERAVHEIVERAGLLVERVERDVNAIPRVMTLAVR